MLFTCELRLQFGFSCGFLDRVDPKSRLAEDSV